MKLRAPITYRQQLFTCLYLFMVLQNVQYGKHFYWVKRRKRLILKRIQLLKENITEIHEQYFTI